MIRPPADTLDAPMPWWRPVAWIAVFPVVLAVVTVAAIWQWWDERLEAKRLAR